MNILLCTDNNYVMPTGVLMHSISINNADVAYYIFVDEAFSEDSKDALRRIATKYGNPLSFFTITTEKTQALPIDMDYQPKRVTMATYYRLFVTEILPPEVHRIIYLDGDMIVRHSLEELWATDLTDKALGVAHDTDEDIHVARLGYDASDGYFNAGMLLINLDYWREHDCIRTFMDYINDNRERIVLHDQDVLNDVFHGKTVWVPMKWNLMTLYLLRPEYYACPERYVQEVKQAIMNPSIIHFSSAQKPWKIRCPNPHTGVWRYYWRKSQWRKDKLQGEEAHSLKEWIKMLLMRHCIWPRDDRFQNCYLRGK